MDSPPTCQKRCELRNYCSRKLLPRYQVWDELFPYGEGDVTPLAVTDFRIVVYMYCVLNRVYSGVHVQLLMK